MLTRSVVVARQGSVPAKQGAPVQPGRPILVSLTLLVFLGLTLLLFGVVTVARAQTIPQIPDIPQVYLPGSPLPKDISCYTPSDEHTPRCSVSVLDQEVHLNLDPETHVIHSTLIPALEHTIGELILSWGTPSGIIQTSHTTRIYWGTRSAHLYTGAVQPDSQVQFILYDLEAPQTSPWGGFGRRKP